MDKTIRIPNSTSQETLRILNKENVFIYDIVSLFGYTVIKCIINEFENDRIMKDIQKLHE